MPNVTITKRFVYCTTSLAIICILLFSVAWFQAVSILSVMRVYHPTLYTKSMEFIIGISLPRKATETITITTEADVMRARKKLTSIIWGHDTYPIDAMPRLVEKNITDDRFYRGMGLNRVDRLTIDMGDGFVSIAYYFHTAQPSTKLIVHHLGHQLKMTAEAQTNDFFIDNGFDVLLFAMPFRGDNEGPILGVDHSAFISDDHSYESFERFPHPLRYFVEPVTVGINYATQQKQYSQVAMLGLSGGGWTTTLMAALDTRITKSYPIAGSLPLSLRLDRTLSPSDAGDFEQRWPTLYDTINYLDLYVLGSVGAGRNQMQVINRYDRYCFAGRRHTGYEKDVAERATRLNGAFSVFLDESHSDHAISNVARAVILKDLNTQY